MFTIDDAVACLNAAGSEEGWTFQRHGDDEIVVSHNGHEVTTVIAETHNSREMTLTDAVTSDVHYLDRHNAGTIIAVLATEYD